MLAIKRGRQDAYPTFLAPAMVWVWWHAVGGNKFTIGSYLAVVTM